MGDSKRFDEMATLIVRHFPSGKYPTIADVAGGSGLLNKALSIKGYTVTSYDGKKRRNIPRNVSIKWKLFDETIKDDYSLIVGMHPDAATDVIIKSAHDRGVPFVIVPCCVIPTTTVDSYGGSDWFLFLTRYAQRLGFDTMSYTLKMQGQNKVLIGRL